VCHACCTLRLVKSKKVLHKLTMRSESVVVNMMTVATETSYDCGHTVICGGQITIHPENRPVVLQKQSATTLKICGFTFLDNVVLCMKAFVFGAVIVTCADKIGHVKLERGILNPTSGSLKVLRFTGGI
jgi:hypothetical protein